VAERKETTDDDGNGNTAGIRRNGTGKRTRDDFRTDRTN
jgi:hypothetical protein